MQRKDLKGAFRWFMLVIYAARGSLRILEDLKAMNAAHLRNSFRCQQGGTTIPKYPHLGQAIIQIIYLHSFLSSPLHWGQKLFLLISHKWHCPAQLIIIQLLWLPWLIGMRVHWSICLWISLEAAAPPISQSLATRAVRDRYCCMDPENRSGTLAKSTWSSRYTEKKAAGSTMQRTLLLKLKFSILW